MLLWDDMMKNFSSDAFNTLVRMMAGERFLIVHRNVRSASIDLVSRVITLPLWSEETPEVAMFFRMHECAHALFTPPQGYHGQNLKYFKNRLFTSYLNVIEDARIDRLMKRRFKGYAKMYDTGYIHLFRRDFFGTTDIKAINEYNLIDRINVKSKTGFSEIEMKSPEESKLFLKVMSTETFDDVIEATKSVYEHAMGTLEESSKQDLLNGLKRMTKEPEDDTAISVEEEKAIDIEVPDGTAGDKSDTGSANDRLDLDESSYGSDFDLDEAPDEYFDELTPITEEGFRKKLSELADETNCYEDISRESFLDTTLSVKYNVTGYKEMNKIANVLDGVDIEGYQETLKRYEDEVIGDYDDDSDEI